MKILLIHPYFLEARIHQEDMVAVPIGLFTIGALLKAEGYAVAILNWSQLSTGADEIRETLIAQHPDVVGMSVLNANRWGAIEIAETAKALDSDVVTVFGGVGATFLWQQLLTDVPALDYIIRGEGEFPFLRLVQALSAKDLDPAAIDGLAYRGPAGPVANRRAKPLQDLDRLPNPATYFTYQHLALTRGCAANCRFCGSPQFWGRCVRSHSPAYFVEQLERLHGRGVSFFYVSDDTFTHDKERVIDVCREIIARRLPIHWAAISRIDRVDAEILRWMRLAGCQQISYGVEHGDPDIRRRLGKDLEAAAIVRTFRLTTAHGIMARAYFIYGAPGETSATIQATIDLMMEMKPLSAIFYLLALFPGTALYRDYCRRTGEDDRYWRRREEDILYHRTDPHLDDAQMLAFGSRLREAFWLALPEFCRAIELVEDPELAPFHADFLSRLGMTFTHGDYAGQDAIAEKTQLAEHLFRRALEYDPHQRAYLGLGILLQKAGRHDACRKLLDAAAGRYPHAKEIHLCLAVSLIALQELPRAIQVLTPFKADAQAAAYLAYCRRPSAGGRTAGPLSS
ncbi:MAG: radical SAM protein [Desulfosarcinaceae bacterium]|nr:radical SAM protein [Desulfosarcinaceae bacterium]